MNQNRRELAREALQRLPGITDAEVEATLDLIEDIYTSQLTEPEMAQMAAYFASQGHDVFGSDDQDQAEGGGRQ